MADEFDKLPVHDIEYPEELDLWFRQYIQQTAKTERSKRRNQMIKKGVTQVAVLFISVTLIATLLSLKTDAFRVTLLNFFTNISELFVGVTVNETSSNIDTSAMPKDWDEYYLPRYMPEGYKITNAEGSENKKVIYYIGADGDEVTFAQGNSSRGLQVNGDGSGISETTVNGMPGLVIKKSESIAILWHFQDETQFFYISGRLDYNTAYKMAASVQLITK